MNDLADLKRLLEGEAGDKLKHFAGGTIIFTTTLALSGNATFSLAAVAAIAAGIEVMDWRTGKGTPSVWDFLATVAGALPVIWALIQ